MDRWVIDLGVARDNLVFPIRNWKSFYVGACDGDALIRVGRPSASALDPYDFGKITLVGGNDYYMYVTNDAQAGKEVVIYIETKINRGWMGLW